jgi:predicted  nucleic acid-binding Zn-ribbon protein
MSQKNNPFEQLDNFSSIGYEQSGKVEGDPHQLEKFLYTLYDHDTITAGYLHDMQNLSEQNSLFEKEIADFNEDLQRMDDKMNKSEEERRRSANQFQEDINRKREEISSIKGGDYSYLNVQADPANKPGFWIGTIILVALTLYLVNFYASVLYNAFLLDPTKLIIESANNNGIIASVTIVNLESFENVFEDYGLIGLVFLISGTFVFISLGFLLHWFTQGNRFWGLVAVYVFTFIFDAFLAYEVVRKIHESRSIVDEVDKWVFSSIFSNAAFYVILFAGFGMYVAWGLLYKYVIEEYRKILPEKTGIRKRKAEINRLKQDMDHLLGTIDKKIQQSKEERDRVQKTEVDFRQNTIRKNLSSIQDLRRKIRDHSEQNDKMANEIRQQITFFVSGWISEIRHRENGSSDSKTEKCHKVVDGFLYKIGYN